MNAAELLADLSERGIRLVADGDRLRYHPRSALTSDLLAELKREKADLLNLLARRSATPCNVLHVDAARATEFYWHQISETDRRYLLAPRHYPGPCPWCGGRLVHNKACDDLRREWVPVIPFGKYRGRRADELPTGYVDWILAHGVGDEQLRGDLRRWRDTDRTNSPGMSARGDP